MSRNTTPCYLFVDGLEPRCLFARLVALAKLRIRVGEVRESVKARCRRGSSAY